MLGTVLGARDLTGASETDRLYTLTEIVLACERQTIESKYKGQTSCLDECCDGNIQRGEDKK